MRALIVDLNNFSRYPTMSVGLIASILRRAEIEVEVLSPFALGVDGYPRTTRPKPWALVDQGLRFWTASTRMPAVRRARAAFVRALRPPRDSNHDVVLEGLEKSLAAGANIVLVSAYTMYFEICRKICQLAADRGVPVLVGGNYFSQPEIVERWLGIPGISAVFGGEPEPVLVELLRSLVDGEREPSVPGVSYPQRLVAPAAPPLQDLDSIPFADYSDFPWQQYPNRVIPMMSGRGCGWGACKFCGDVVTSSGRQFRSRSPENVLAEMQYQHGRHDSKLFTFLDLKLNSNQAVWRALAEQSRSVVPGAQWTASLHLDARDGDGLSAQELHQAKQGGLVRLTTGLESGSQRVLNAMAKGTRVERTSEMLHHAHEAGISIRLTVMIGYPGEEPGDVAATADFLDRHRGIVDRVVLGRLSVMLGAGLHQQLASRPTSVPQLTGLRVHPDSASVDHRNDTFLKKHYRRNVWKLLKAIHRINRKPLSAISREFEGVM